MLRFQRDAGNEAGKMPTLPGNTAFHITQFYSHPTATITKNVNYDILRSLTQT